VNDLSLHVGVGTLDPAHYPPVAVLRRCEADAQSLAAVAEARGYSTRSLLGSQATTSAVLGALAEAARRLSDGDSLLFTFSGHGGRLPDLTGDEGADPYDETLCLYDRELLDDELFVAWCRFAKGVRIVMVADSCHSGTAHRLRDERDERVVEWKGTTRQQQDDLLSRHLDHYIDVARDAARRRTTLGAHVLLVAACGDNERAAEGREHGLLTGALVDVLPTCDSYDALQSALRARLDGVQRPRVVTANWPDALRATRPFAPAASAHPSTEVGPVEEVGPDVPESGTSGPTST
jgi:hypothetical protein